MRKFANPDYLVKVTLPGKQTLTFCHVGEVRAFNLCLQMADQRKAKQAAIKRVEYWEALTFCEKVLEYFDRKPSAEDYKLAAN